MRANFAKINYTMNSLQQLDFKKHIDLLKLMDWTYSFIKNVLV